MQSTGLFSGRTNPLSLRKIALRRAASPLGKYRTIKVVSWRVNFPSGADADFAGLLVVNQENCIRWLAP